MRSGRENQCLSKCAFIFFLIYSHISKQDVSIQLSTAENICLNFGVYLLRGASQVVKNLPDRAGVAGDTGSIAGLGRAPGRGHGNSPQYSCLGSPMDRES